MEWVDGSKYNLDKYVKRLWLTLRDNREKLENLGLSSDISTAIFQSDDQFIPILNSACKGKSTSRTYLYSHPPQHFLTKSGLFAEPEPRVRRSEHLPEPR